MTPEGLQALRDDEGSRADVYDDKTGRSIRPGATVVGHPTIGIGHALDMNPLTPDEIEYIFEDDVANLEAQLFQLDWFTNLDPVRQDVMTNVAFNLGVGGLLGFHRMIAALQQQDYPRAKAELLDSDAARDLPRRYAALASTLLSGAWGSS